MLAIHIDEGEENNVKNCAAMSYHHLSRRWFRPECIFLIFFLLMGLPAALLIPAGGGFDEPSHVARIDQLSYGQIMSEAVATSSGVAVEDAAMGDILYGGSIDKGLVETADENLKTYQVSDAARETYSFPTWISASLSSAEVYGSAQTVYVFSNTAVYSPVSYIPQVIALCVGRLFISNAYALIVLMRVAGLLFIAFVIFFCIRVIPIGKWTMVFIGLLPSFVISNAQVTADTMTDAVLFVFITCTFIFLLRGAEASRKDWSALVISSLMLGLVKVSYLPIVALLGAVPLMRADMRKRMYIGRLVLIVMGAIAMFLVWYGMIKSINTGAMFATGANPGAQLSFVIQHPLHFLRLLTSLFVTTNILNLTLTGIIAAVSSAKLIPCWWIEAILLCLSVSMEDQREQSLSLSNRNLFLLLASCVIVFILVFSVIGLAIYLQFNPIEAAIISGVQPRYFIPILPVLLLPIAVFVRWYWGNEINGNQIGRVDSEQGHLFISQSKYVVSSTIISVIYFFMSFSVLFVLFVNLF